MRIHPFRAAASYGRRPVRLFDSGRREMLSFRIPTERFAEMLREVVRRLTPASARVR